MPAQSYSPSKALPASAVPAWDLETDVIIVGFGAAGATAAIEAAAAGARVTLFEMASGSGGSSALSGGEIYFGGSGGTPAQRDAGFVDETEDLYNYILAISGPDPDTAKIRLYAENSLAHYHWLVEQGVPFKNTYIPEKIIEPTTDDTLIWSGSEEAWPFRDLAKPCPRGHVVQWEGWGGGRMLIDRLEARARALGVDVRFDSRVLCLVVEPSGRVAGAVVRNEGRELFVRAQRGVILCAGGFCMNLDMVRRYCPDILRSNDPIGAGNDNGSGILMGMSAGGDAIHLDQFFTTCPWYPPESLVTGIFVNALGQRFINEDCYHGRVSGFIMRQAGDRVFLLLDQGNFGRPMELARADVAAVGESWEEVEADLGLTSGTLTSTVEIYNRGAAAGVDPVWHKHPKWLRPLVEPPFAAIEFRIGYSYFSWFTLGGLSTLPTGEVLDRDGNPVPGLYAAGRTTSGLPRWGVGYSSGLSLADCTFFGRQAGISAARAEHQAI